MNRPYAVKTRSPLKGKLTPKSTLAKIEMGIALGVSAHQMYTKCRDWYRKRVSFSVVVSEKDLLYHEVHDWLVTVLPSERHKDLMVSSVRYSNSNEVDDSISDAVKPKPLVIRFNENTGRDMEIDGHRITVHLQTPEPSETKFSREPDWKKIMFQARSHEGQQAVLKQLERLNEARVTTRRANLKMVGQWGNWTTRSDLPPRSMASVSLPEEQKKRITDDLGEFLKAEDQYNKLAIPWHRGYMFYGPPGTGKTSLVKALANEFNLDLWYVSVADLKAESSLLALLGEVGPRSLLLLEDIDTMKITHDRDGAEQGTISMSSLLNTLDGVATPHGLITVMTTNRFDILDPALTRAGRMDLVEELSWPTLRTLGEMFHHFYGSYPEWSFHKNRDVEIVNLSTAQVAEVMKRHMNNAAVAEAAVKQVLVEHTFARV